MNNISSFSHLDQFDETLKLSELYLCLEKCSSFSWPLQISSQPSPSHSHSQTPFHLPGLLETPSCHAGGVKQYNPHPLHTHRRLFIHLAFCRLHHVMQVGSNSTFSILFTLTDAFSSTWPFGCRWEWDQTVLCTGLRKTPLFMNIFLSNFSLSL